jgi:hypothetical protein
VLPIQSAAYALFSAIEADQPVHGTGTTGEGSEPNPNAMQTSDPGDDATRGPG